MVGTVFSNMLFVCEPLLCLVALAFVLRRRNESEYGYFCLLLFCRICISVMILPLLLFGGRRIEAHVAYSSYFWIYWTGFAVEAVLSLLVIYSIFDLAMAPLEGIRRLGVVALRWVMCVSLAVVSGSILLPHPNEQAFVIRLVTELQRTQSVLNLCLLLFVCFAIRPLGLSYKSRVFGISLGLGILATAKLIIFGWIANSKQLYSYAGLVDVGVTCAVLLLWIGYFAAPEAKRRIIVLPTTSPFLRWNQISQALGDSPGFVAIGGIPPELFAPAELEVMRRASLKIVSRTVDLVDQSQTA